MPESHCTWLTRPGLGPTSPHDGLGSGLQMNAVPASFPWDFPSPLPQTSRNPSSSWRAGPPPPCRQRERPQSWPLCNDQITGQAGRSDKRPIYFGAFSNPGCPHPADENGETGGSVTPGPVSRSRRRVQTEQRTIPWHQGKRQGLPGPGSEEAPLRAWVTWPVRKTWEPLPHLSSLPPPPPPMSIGPPQGFPHATPAP